MKTTRQELALKGISKITEETDLSTISFNNRILNGGLICINDDEVEVTVRPNFKAWDDGSKHVEITGTGVKAELWFTKDGRDYSLSLDFTSPDSFKAGLKLPQQVLQWALDKAA